MKNYPPVKINAARCAANLLSSAVLALCLLALTACSPPPSTQDPVGDTRAENQPIKSPNDEREYRFVQLDNELKVLLIRDDATDKAAASLVVFRGLHDDPAKHLGLAHFLEHMLFLGTEKYPDVDAYESFVTTHGGSYNAYTAADHTNYFFDIEPGYFIEALDRFAQFFIAPLFLADYVEREKNAVNSEYQLQIKEDAWRGQAVQRVLMNPAHPASRFGVGSTATLAGVTPAGLKTFFERNYSADQMALAVLTNQPLDAMEAEVRSRFAAIENREIGSEAASPTLFEAGRLPVRLVFQNVKNVNRLSFNFPIPSVDDKYRSKPQRYIADLLGHEGVGSLHAALKGLGWIESLAAGTNRIDAWNAMLTVSLELTESGKAHVEDIKSALFDHVETIRQRGVEAWRYDEQGTVAELSFRFQEKGAPMRTVMAAAANLRLYEPRDILRAPYLMERFDKGQIEHYLSFISADNVLVEVSGPDVKTDQVEKWFHVPYAVLPEATPAVASDATRTSAPKLQLALPKPNAYLPKNLELATRVPVPFDSAPKNTQPYEHLALWVAEDTEFGTPRASVRLDVHVDRGLQTPTDITMATLYARLVKDRLNAASYPAQLAGLQYSVRTGAKGLHITLSGYDDKLAVLFEDVVSEFTDHQVDATKLAQYKAELLKDYGNFKNERPYTQALAGLRQLIVSSSWPPDVLAKALQDVTKAKLQTWLDNRMAEVSAALFLHGNLTDERARQFAKITHAKLSLAEVDVVDDAPRMLEDSFQYGMQVDHGDAAFVMYLQGRDSSYAERARLGLLAHMLRTPYFKTLRTEQQLGYVVSVSPSVFRTVPGISFIVQSPVASPREIEAATLEFLGAEIKDISAMPIEDFEEHKQGLIARLTERDKNLMSRSRRLWSDFEVGIYSFDSRAEIASEVAAIGRDELVDTFKSLIGADAHNRLVVFTPGRFEGRVESGKTIESVEAFKRT